MMQIDLADANENMDMPAHVDTYRHFVGFVKYSIGALVILLIGMAIFLT
ncbi:MAG: aa3-type cytochrome c oxidase subunit IV [Rhodomicrobium sp.]